MPAQPVPPADPELDALDAALATVGDRWTLAVVACLLDGARRFGELQEALPGIAPNVLAARLKRLEGEGIVTARPYQERPRRFAYELAGEGRELASVVRLLAEWGARRATGRAAPVRHAVCGTPLETRWWCPSCEEVADAGGEREDEVWFA